MAARKRGLGRGLDALLGQPPGQAATVADTADAGASRDGELREISCDWIHPGRFQPRRSMDPQALEELAASIRSQGLMQPIVVRQIADQSFEIIAGERRWRASQLAGLGKVPVLVRDVAEESAFAMSLIENIQRENLNPIEEAAALKRLQDEFALTHEQIAATVGKGRTTVTNLLRLMDLADEVKHMLENGDIEMGHARALLGLPPEQQCQAAREVVAKSLNVRQTETLVRCIGSKKKSPTAPGRRVDTDTRRLEESLSSRIGQPVSIRHGARGKGRLVIRYASLDELDGILGHLGHDAEH